MSAQRQFRTVIRMGAAHQDVTATHIATGEVAFKALFPPAEPHRGRKPESEASIRRKRFRQTHNEKVGREVCALHDIVGRNKSHRQRRKEPKGSPAFIVATIGMLLGA